MKTNHFKTHRFTKKQAELAAKISNDIAEGIDCGESRHDLRMAVSYFSYLANTEAQFRVSAEEKLEFIRLAKALIDSALTKHTPTPKPKHK